MFELIFVEQRGEAPGHPFEQTNRIHIVDLNDTSSELTSFAENFLSSTEMSKIGQSKNEKRARTDPQLLKAMPGPDLSSVLSFWGKRPGTN